MKPASTDPAVLERLQGRLDRVGLSPRDAAREAGLAHDALDRLLAGIAPLPRGKSLQRLADVLGCSISYLVGLEPDEPPPEELLAEDQGTLGPLLSGDQEALLRAYNGLDMASKAALLHVARKMAGPEPEPIPEVPPPPRRRAAVARKAKT
jgi:transcriptional regulator with XRE-family HTH domain